MAVGTREREALRRLAGKWMDAAQLPAMKDRERQWRAVKDLKAERPMILVETCMLPDYIGQDELVNSDPYLRNIEKSLFEIVRHAEELGDDIVVEPRFRLPWLVELSDYGLPMGARHALNSEGNDLGYSFDFSLKTPAGIAKLRFRTRRVDRAKTAARKELLEGIFGDLLPVTVGGYDPFDLDPGYHPWLGNLHAGLTMDFFKLAGNDALLYWVYDEPGAVHALMRFLADDRIRHFRWLEEEGLLYRNTDTWMPCPGSYGYVSDLEVPKSRGAPRLSDCWGWSESQETAPISPAMFAEFFLPYLAEVNGLFGLSYYGCCEGLHDRIEPVIKANPNLRAVSVSGWSDLFRMGEILGRDYVYSRKPTPAYISGTSPDWDRLEKDVRDTLLAARDCNLELCFRDIYTIDGDRPRLRAWVDMARSLIG
jgi:hypothetical protein